MKMIGPNSMYKMRPVVKLAEEIELPSCMYKMKVIQISHCINPPRKIPNEPFASIAEQGTPEVAALENRQEAILLQLSHLKQQLCSIREQLKNSPATLGSSVNPSICKEAGLLEEIVVKANPQWPPYSLLALDQVMKSALNIQCCKHSDSYDLPEDLKFFERKSFCPLFNIRLIWKQVTEVEFIVSPTKHSVMHSEVNLLRFLSRTGPKEFNYESSCDPLTTCLADGLLDSCYKLVKESSLKIRLALVRDLGELLKKNTFLMGERVSIVDMALWSALKQIGLIAKSTKDIPASVHKWFVNCNAIFGSNLS